MLTVLATVLAAPLLAVEITPDEPSPDAAFTAFYEQLDDSMGDAALVEGSNEVVAPAAGKALGSLSSSDLTSTRLLSSLTVGGELRAEADAEALAELSRAEEARRAAEREAAEREAAERAAAERAASERSTTTTAPAPPPAPVESATPPADGPGPEQWAALRRCESGGNYRAVNTAGPFYGAYQFMQSTWNGIARRTGRTDLSGVRPDHAAPADQDAMAYALHARRGASPWPHCGVHLR